VSQVSDIFNEAFRLGLKGYTVYRSGSRVTVVEGRHLPTAGTDVEGKAHPCDFDRESD
jgi:hypothetical protein